MTSNNIYDTANQLEKDIRNLPAFAQLKEAFKAIQADEASSALFDEFKQTSQELQMKQMSGEQPGEEEMEALQALFAKVTENESIKSLMDSEQQLSQVMEDVNRIITKPLQEIYESKE